MRTEIDNQLKDYFQSTEFTGLGQLELNVKFDSGDLEKVPEGVKNPPSEQSQLEVYTSSLLAPIKNLLVEIEKKIEERVKEDRSSDDSDAEITTRLNRCYENLLSLKENLLDMQEWGEWPSVEELKQQSWKQDLDPMKSAILAKGTKITRVIDGKEHNITVNLKVLIFYPNDLTKTYFYAENDVDEMNSRYDNRGNYITRDPPTKYLINNYLRNGIGNELKWLPMKKSIFPDDGKCLASHVQQGGLGDCFLIAALISLCNSNPYFFSRITLETDAHVYVKMSNPFSGNSVPVFIQVEKSKTEMMSICELYNWPAIIEKAFAIYMSSRKSQTPTNVDPENNDAMIYLWGGFSAEPLSYLTGEKHEERSLIAYRGTSMKKELMNLHLWNEKEKMIAKDIVEKMECSAWSVKYWTDSSYDLNMLFFWSTVIPDEDKKDLSADDKHEIIGNWFQFIADGRLAFFLEDRLVRQGNKRINIEDFKSLLNGTAVGLKGKKKISISGLSPAKSRDWLMKWIELSDLFKKVGIGYKMSTPDQIELLGELEQYLKSNNPLVLGSKNKENLNTTTFGSHAYALEKVNIENTTLLLIDPNGRPDDTVIIDEARMTKQMKLELKELASVDYGTIHRRNIYPINKIFQLYDSVSQPEIKKMKIP